MKTAKSRKTSQYIMPAKKMQPEPGKYDIYPAHLLGEGKIFSGYEKLAREIQQHQTIIIDGYVAYFGKVSGKNFKTILIS